MTNIGCFLYYLHLNNQKKRTFPYLCSRGIKAYTTGISDPEFWRNLRYSLNFSYNDYVSEAFVSCIRRDL